MIKFDRSKYCRLLPEEEEVEQEGGKKMKPQSITSDQVYQLDQCKVLNKSALLALRKSLYSNDYSALKESSFSAGSNEMTSSTAASENITEHSITTSSLLV